MSNSKMDESPLSQPPHNLAAKHRNPFLLNTKVCAVLEDLEMNGEYVKKIGEALNEFDEINQTCIKNFCQRNTDTEFEAMFKLDQATKNVLRKIKNVLPSCIVELLATSETLTLTSEIGNFLSHMEYYWQENDILNEMSAAEKVSKLEKFLPAVDGVFQHDSKELLSMTADLCEDAKGNFMLDVLFASTQTWFAYVFLLFEQFVFLANNYFQCGDIAKHNKYFDQIYFHYKNSKKELLGTSTEIGFLQKVKNRFQKSYNLGKPKELFSCKLVELSAFENALNTTTLPISLDKPEKVLSPPDFSKSQIETPMGSWDKHIEVIYALQYTNDGIYSKVSDWSVPFAIANKANPQIHLPPTQHESKKLIFRKFSHKKPELVGIVEAGSSNIFHDIDRDLYNAAGNPNEIIAIKEFEILLANGANPSSSFENGANAMHAAASANNLKLIRKYLLTNFKDQVNSRNQQGYTALHIAAESGHEKLVELLLENDADPNMKCDFKQWTPIFLAAYKGHDKVLKALLGIETTDRSMHDDFGCTPLHCAVFGGAKGVTALIESKYFDANVKTNAGLTPLRMAVLKKDLDVAKVILSLEPEVKDQLAAFHLAVITENTEIVNHFLNARIVDVNAASTNNWTALHLAVATKNESVILELLKQRKLNVNAKTTAGLAPLHIAAKLNLGNAVAYLLAAGATIDAATPLGMTPLHMAAKYGCQTALRVLVESEANLELRTHDGLTPLLVAAAFKDSTAATLMYLIENGSNLQAASNEGLTFEWLAAQQGGADVVRFLFKNYKGPNLTDNRGNNLLHHAVLGSNFDVVTLLVDELNFDVNILNKDNQTALHFAKDLDIVEFLVCGGTNMEADDLFDNLLSHEAKVINGCCKNFLNFAIEKENLKIIKYLNEKKVCNIQLASINGNAALFAAARLGKLEAVKYFIEDQNVNANIRDQNGNTILHLAAENDHLNVVKYLINEKGLNINATNGESATALHCAAKSASLNTVKFLLGCGADLNCKDNNHCDLLHRAAEGGNVEIIKFLIEVKEFPPYDQATDGRIALHCAAEFGKLEAVRYFVENARIDINTNKNKRQRTALHVAAENGQLDVVKYLIEEQGADIEAKDFYRHTPLLLAACSNSLATVKFLLEIGADIKAKNNINGSLLHLASQGGNVEIIKFLIAEKEFVPHEKTYDDRNPLHYAAEIGKLDAVQYFVENTKIDINQKEDTYEKTALHLAARNGQLDVVKYLIQEHGADIKTDDYFNNTPLLLAAQSNRLASVKFFLEIGADINDKNMYEQNLLHLAAQGGNLEIIKFLIDERNFDPNCCDASNYTPLSLAAFSGKLDAVKYFMETARVSLGADQLPLYRAISGYSTEIVKYLVENQNVDLNVKDKNGNTPLKYAQTTHAIEIVEYLKSQGAT